MKQKRFKVEEFYKGEWQPCMVNHKGKKIQKVVKITESDAEINNIYKAEHKMKYILEGDIIEDSTEFIEAKETYKELYGKLPHYKWDLDTLKIKISEKQ
jgi:hypothetical protein